MTYTVRQLAEMVGGTVDGDAGIAVTAARPLADAGAGDITFFNSGDRERLDRCTASAVVVGRSEPPVALPAIRVADPFEAFLSIALVLHPQVTRPPAGVHSLAAVDESATVGADAEIQAFAAVGAGATIGARCRLHSGVSVGRNCRLGSDVVLHPNVVLYDNTILGDRVVIHANAVIGADGFGYRFRDGRHVKIPQLGCVEIADDVEIGACTTIDRATFGSTRIGRGTKIDNQVMIGHNCQLGQHNILVGQVGMAGSCTTGDYVTMAGQVGIRDHVHIGDRSTLGAKAAIARDVPPDSRMLGAPATPEHEQKRIIAAVSGLPDLRKTVSRIVRHLGLPAAESSSPTSEAA